MASPGEERPVRKKQVSPGDNSVNRRGRSGGLDSAAHAHHSEHDDAASGEVANRDLQPPSGEEMRRLYSELRISEERIRAVLEAAVDAIITIDTSGRIETFNKAAEMMFGYSAAEALDSNVSILMGAPHRGKHDDYIRRYQETGEAHVIGRRRNLKGRRKDGSEFPIQLTVSAVDHLGLFTGIVHDMTEQMTLQEEIVRVATFEQRRIARALHDSIQQDLTGLGLLAQNLVDALGGTRLTSELALAGKIAAGIAETNRHVRRLAKGLMPVPIDSDGLSAALSDLALRVESDHGIRCTFDCPSPVLVTDDNAAVQLYHIVAEAVTNAIKHSRADTIAIQLLRSGDTAIVKVKDNGQGIVAQHSAHDGLGLRIMAHRSEILGGTCTVRRRKTGGTCVVCSAPVARMD